MENANWFTQLLRIANVVLDYFRQKSRQDRVDTVRTDPGSAWVRKMGGNDQRVIPPIPKDVGRGGD